jgi:YD repeat-containing protein
VKNAPKPSSLRTARILSLILCYSLLLSTVFIPSRAESNSSTTATSTSFWTHIVRQFTASLFFLPQGGPPTIPGSGLPDLDAAKALNPTDPAAVSPIDSTQSCTDCSPCSTCGPGTQNHAPIANAGGPYAGAATQAVRFNGMSSFDVDPGDGISDYAWNFGDNTAVVHDPMPEHTYQSSGNYTVTLTVTDRHSATQNKNVTAVISAAPSPSPSPSPGSGQGNAATFVSQSVPSTMTAGATYQVSVKMRNTGNTTWTASSLYRLGSQNAQDNITWGQARIYLTDSLAPGAEVTFSFSVIAPGNGLSSPPSKHFQWRMVQDGVDWFGDYTTDQIVTINSHYLPEAPNGYSDLFTARIAPQNRTGQPGEDLLSRNFNWGLPLVNLPGRAGLDLDLSLSYNSLIWTRVDSTSYSWPPQTVSSFTYDADRGSPSAGFRLGFPSIQGPFYNQQSDTNSYLMLLPSGARREFRQQGSSNVYESVDSSYMQLLDGGNGSLLVRGSDGTQMAYWSINNEYRCTEIKDRNGNFITIKYDPINSVANLGRITSVIDTLGRTVTFNYDANYRLRSISQVWDGQAHNWATFGYGNKSISPSFSTSEYTDAAVLGLPSNYTVSALTQVGLADGSQYQFDYTSYGQVYQIRHLARDGHLLQSTAYDLPTNSLQADCPRFNSRSDWAENWNGGNAVTTNFDSNLGTYQVYGTAVDWGSLLWSEVILPDGTKYREYALADYGNWQKGLVTKTEIRSGGAVKKTTTTDWTADRIDVGYQQNARAWGVTVSDADGNRSRTHIDYTSFGLPSLHLVCRSTCSSLDQRAQVAGSCCEEPILIMISQATTSIVTFLD